MRVTTLTGFLESKITTEVKKQIYIYIAYIYIQKKKQKNQRVVRVRIGVFDPVFFILAEPKMYVEVPHFSPGRPDLFAIQVCAFEWAKGAPNQTNKQQQKQ